MIVALTCIFAVGLKPQLVAPVAGIAVALTVFVFGSRFTSGQKDPSPTQPRFQPPVSREDESDPKVEISRIIIFVLLLAIAFNAVIYAVEAWRGTLDTYALRAIIPRVALAIVLIA
jgi:hypothetical protein